MRYNSIGAGLVLVILACSIANSMTLPLQGDWNPTQDFGVWNASWQGYHLAEDVTRNSEVAVYAIADGYVQFSQQHIDALGYPVIIEHTLPDDSKYCSFYGHLRLAGLIANHVYVSEGQLIGYLTSVEADNQGVIHIHSGIRMGAYTSTSVYMYVPSQGWKWTWQYPGYTRNANYTQRTDEPYDITHDDMKAQWRAMGQFVADHQNTFSAAYVSQTPTHPTGIIPAEINETKTITFTFHNSGTASWTYDGNSPNYVELASVNSGFTGHETSTLLSPASNTIGPPTSVVSAGANCTWSFNVTMPSSPGTPALRVRIYHPDQSEFISPMYIDVHFNVVDPNPNPPFLSGEDFVPLVGYFDGDLKEDIAVWEPATGNLYLGISNGVDEFIRKGGPGYNGSMFQTPWNPPGTGPFQPFVGDFSNDGYDDLALLDKANGRWYVAYNWGSYFAQANGSGAQNSWISSGWGESPYIAFVADFNADDSADIGVFHPTYGRWSVACKQGNHFDPVFGPYTGGSWLTNWKVGSSYKPFVADFSADGYTDVALMLSTIGRWYVAYNDIVPSPINFIPTATYWKESGWGESPYISFTGKFNVDDSADIMVYHPGYGSWSVAKKSGQTFTAIVGAGYGGSWLSGWKTSASLTYEPLVGDFSGDGYTDVCLYEPSEGRWYVAFNWAAHQPYPEFEIEDGPYDDAWLAGWAVETGGAGKRVGDNPTAMPTSFIVNQNYPNPFNPATTISYSLPEATHVSLEVFNILGQRVDRLLDTDQPAGDYQVNWDASRFASGIYFYRLQTEAAVETKKMLLLK